MQALPHESLLELLAEVSVAFVGFSMLASVLRPNVQEERARLFGFRDVAETSLIAALGSIAPLVLDAFGLSYDLIWKIAGGVVGSVWLVGTVASRRRQDFSAIREFAPASAVLLPTISAIPVFVAFANVLFPSGARHVLLIVSCLTTSALLFLFAAFSVKPRSKATQNDGSDAGKQSVE